VSRRAHLLRGNKSLEMPWECVWYDTETHQEQSGWNAVSHTLSFGWAAFRRRSSSGTWLSPTWARFSTVVQFWDWVESLLHGKARLYLFSHNSGFDLPVLHAFTELPARGWKLTRAVIDCPPLILKWRRGKQTLMFLDTLNIWRMSLAELGKKVQLDKLQMPAPTASAAEWDTYGKRDTEIIMAACIAWFDFLTRHQLGSFAPTAASQAMRAYRHRFMDVKILIDDDEYALALSRQAYLGGKVECRRIGIVRGPVYRLDVNSMYPYVMRDNYFPIRLVGVTGRCSLQDALGWLNSLCVVADVDLFTPEPAYPVLDNGKLIFPINRLRTTLTTPELRYALEHGHVERVHAAACYERAVIFREYVEEFWRIRRAAHDRGDKVEEEMAKKLPNSFYGKWGQRGRVYGEEGEWPTHEAQAWIEIDADTGTIIKHRCLGGLHQVFREDSESRDSFPAIAAHVTAYARLHLWELELRAGREHTLYMDTDSLAVLQPGYDALMPMVNPGELGALKLEGVEAWAIFRGPKDYEYPSHHKTKGVRKSAHWIEPNAVVQDQWSTLKGLLRLKDLSAPITSSVAKQLSRHYAKGLITPSGRVLPYSLG
jgi:DNA polymerase type B, organellar and viral